MNFDENPFASIFAEGGQPNAQPVPQAAPPQTAPAQAPQGMPMQGAGGEQMMGPDELQPGKTGDNTKPLLGAIQALHNYIAGSTDQGTIQLVRNLISALTQLVARDQQAGEQLAQQQMAQMQQGGQGPTPGV